MWRLRPRASEVGLQRRLGCRGFAARIHNRNCACGNTCTPPVAATAFTIQDCRENLTSSSPADGFVCSFMVASGTAARNALTDGANQSRTVLTGCQKSAGTSAATYLMHAGCAMQVGRCLSSGNVRSQILANWSGFGVRFWIESTDRAGPFPDA